MTNNPARYIDPDGTTIAGCELQCWPSGYDPSISGINGNNQPDLASMVGGSGNCAYGTSCYAQNEAYYDQMVQASQQKLLNQYFDDQAANQAAQQAGTPQTTGNCSVDRALATVPGAIPTGPNTNAAVNGHLEVGISVTEATLLVDGFRFYQGPFGANGYRQGNVIVSAHVNGIGGQLSPTVFQGAANGVVNAQVHFDTFNPATGLFGLIGHGGWDVFVGFVFFHHSAGLDQRCS